MNNFLSLEYQRPYAVDLLFFIFVLYIRVVAELLFALKNSICDEH